MSCPRIASKSKPGKHRAKVIDERYVLLTSGFRHDAWRQLTCEGTGVGGADYFSLPHTNRRAPCGFPCCISPISILSITPPFCKLTFDTLLSSLFLSFNLTTLPMSKGKQRRRSPTPSESDHHESGDDTTPQDAPSQPPFQDYFNRRDAPGKRILRPQGKSALKATKAEATKEAITLLRRPGSTEDSKGTRSSSKKSVSISWNVE